VRLGSANLAHTLEPAKVQHVRRCPQVIWREPCMDSLGDPAVIVAEHLRNLRHSDTARGHMHRCRVAQRVQTDVPSPARAAVRVNPLRIDLTGPPAHTITWVDIAPCRATVSAA